MWAGALPEAFQEEAGLRRPWGRGRGPIPWGIFCIQRPGVGEGTGPWSERAAVSAAGEEARGRELCLSCPL